MGGTKFSEAGCSLSLIVRSIASGNPVAAVSTGLTVGAYKESGGEPSFGLIMQAITTNTKANMLSTPSIMTLDNQEAEIIVGQNVPFRTGSTASSTNTNPFTTITREDVGKIGRAHV